MANERRLRHQVGDEDLRWLVDAVWPSGEGPDAGAGTYQVIPSRRRPWLLLPRLGRRASWRALAAGWRLQSHRHRAIRAVGAAHVLVRGHRRGGADDGSGAAGSPPSVLARLAAEGRGSAGALVVLGEADPNRKPTLQLLDEQGGTVGYAKVGWNDATRRLVRHEAEVLTLLADRLAGQERLRAPAVDLVGSWPDRDVLVTLPMPPRARVWAWEHVPDDELIRLVAAALSEHGRVESRPLRELRLWGDHRSALARAAEHCPSETAVLRDAIDRALESAPADVRVPEGGWHGDLTPWNLAVADEVVWLWDWEHAHRSRPLGFDLLHYEFAVMRHVHRRSTVETVEGLRQAADRLLVPLGVDPHAVEAVTLGYLVERWLRSYEVSRTGAGWDAAIHPGVVEAVARW